MKMSKIGHYLFLFGVVLSVVAGFVDFGIPKLGTMLAVLGLITGFLNVSGAETRTFLIAGIAFLVTASALNGLADSLGIGSYVSAIALNLSTFAAPAVLLVALKSLLSTAGD